MIWVDDCGAGWAVRSPRTTSEVLHALGFSALDYNNAALSGSIPSGGALLHITEWLAARIYRVDDLEDEDGPIVWRELDEGERIELLDMVLTQGEQLRLFDAILASVSLDRDTLTQVRAYLQLCLDGGCGCVLCRDQDAEETPRRVAACLTRRHPRHVRHLVGLWTPVMDEPVLDHPYWLHQIRDIYLQERGQKRREHQQKTGGSTRDRNERARLSNKYGLW